MIRPSPKLIETSSERNFFEESLYRPAVREEFVKAFCQHNPQNLSAALMEMDRFLVANPDFCENDRHIAETIKLLKSQVKVPD